MPWFRSRWRADRGPAPGQGPGWYRRPVILVRGERAFLVVEFAFQHPQAGVGQVAGVAPAQEFLALGVDDGSPGPHGRLVPGVAAGTSSSPASSRRPSRRR